MLILAVALSQAADMSIQAALSRKMLEQAQAVIGYVRKTTKVERGIVGGPSGATVTLTIADVEVLSPPELPKRISIAYPGPLAVDKRSLVFIVRRTDAKVATFSSYSEVYPKRLLTETVPNTYAASFYSPTGKVALPKLAGPDQIIGALIQSVDPQDDRSYDRLAKLIGTANPKWVARATAVPPEIRSEISGQTNSSAWVADRDPVSPIIVKELERAGNEYQRSRLLEVMVRWRYAGATKNYFESLRSLLRSRTAYGSQVESSRHWGLIENLNAQYGDIDGYVPYPVSQWVGEVSTAANPVLKRYFLNNFGSVMSRGDMKKFAKLLDDPEISTRFRCATILASQLQLEEAMPSKDGVIEGKVVQYPDLAEKIRMIKRNLGL